MKTSELQGAALDWAVAKCLGMTTPIPATARWKDVENLAVPFTLWEVSNYYDNDVFARCETHPITVTRCSVMEGTGATLPSISFTDSNGRKALGSIADYYLTKEAAEVDVAVTMAGGEYWDGYTPSTNWEQGGPIIDREGIETRKGNPLYFPKGNESGDHYEPLWLSGKQQGTTPLIAAMRCYVASKLGDEVEIPEGLK
jgi:hypothetical protein